MELAPYYFFYLLCSERDGLFLYLGEGRWLLAGAGRLWPFSAWSWLERCFVICVCAFFSLVGTIISTLYMIPFLLLLLLFYLPIRHTHIYIHRHARVLNEPDIKWEYNARLMVVIMYVYVPRVGLG